MRRSNLLLLALMLLSGCETLNDAVVRYWFKDPALGRAMRHQIKEGLQRREKMPPVTGPKAPAPPFMDEGRNKMRDGGDGGEVVVAGNSKGDEFACLRR